jgi:TRAP-type uncharacterized transport system substrate-binding protein
LDKNGDGSGNSSVDFGMVQSDVAHRAWKGELPFEERHDDSIRLVAPLSTEKLHVLVRPHQYLTSIAQLKNRRIWLGVDNSGSKFSAETILQAAGFSTDDLKKSTASIDRASALVLLPDESGEQDGLAVVVDRPPKKDVLSQFLESKGIRIVSLPPLNGVSFNVLLAPDFAFNNLSDLKNAAVQVPADCCRAIIEKLTRMGIKRIREDQDSLQALKRLQSKEITALIQPEPLSLDMMCAIMKFQGIAASPLPAVTGNSGTEDLMAFVASSANFQEALDQVIQRKERIWWPDEGSDFDDRVIQALIPGSGADVTARREELRHADRGLTAVMAFDLLRRGYFDAVFQATAAPDSRITDLVNRTEIRFLGIDWPLVEKLDSDGSYIETSLQPTAYRVLDQGVYTVGVQTLLLTRLSAEGDEGYKVQLLAKFLRTQQRAIQDNLRDPKQPNWPNALTLIGSPVRKQIKPYVHSSAEPYLVTGRLRPATWLQLCLLTGGIAFTGLLGSRVERGRRLCAYHADKILVVLGCLSFWTIGAIWLQAVEGEISEDFVSLWAAGLSLTRTVLAHFHLPTDPPQPTTHAGGLVMGIFSWIGAALVAAFLLPPLKSLWQSTLRPRLEQWRMPPSSTPVETGRAHSNAA